MASRQVGVPVTLQGRWGPPNDSTYRVIPGAGVAQPCAGSVENAVGLLMGAAQRLPDPDLRDAHWWANLAWTARVRPCGDGEVRSHLITVEEGVANP